MDPLSDMKTVGLVSIHYSVSSIADPDTLRTIIETHAKHVQYQNEDNIKTMYL